MMFTDKEVLNIVKGITTLRLKFSTRIVLVKLIDLAKNNELVIERAQLSMMCNVSIETVGRAIKQLKELEYIGVEMRRAMGLNGVVVRGANNHVISFQRISLAIAERDVEIQRELIQAAA